MSAGCREVDRNCKTRYRWRCCSQHRPRTLIPDITLVNIAETFSILAGFFLRLKRFFLPRDVNVSSRENISIFFSLPLFYPTIYYHRCIVTTRTDLARRCVNERIDKGEKLVNFYGPPFLFHGIRIGTVEKKPFLGETIFPLNH